ncbi:MAG: hypothetical protein JWM16_1040, partial [Verrucomicrobiales bacterium]|nr:hypothetical protein [Verrucomicrobiales bacterium]
MLRVCALYLLALLLSTACGFAQEASGLAGTTPLRVQGDLSAQMVSGIDKHLAKLTAESVAGRAKFWKRDLGSAAAYENSIQPNREHLRAMIGAVDPRVTNSVLEYVSTAARSAKVAETERYLVYAVRWEVLDDVHGEGLLLQPKQAIAAKVVVLPDADQTPEMLAGLAPGISPESQFARVLANNNCAVLVPTLISRADTWSGSEKLKRFTNQPHREWIYRQAYEMGRHIIGYEVEKVSAALDALSRFGGGSLPMGVAGYGEGGLIAFYAAALDNRVQSALVSGYFGSREQLWQEPIYRNVFGLLREFGDAEIASLIAPRALIVEHSEAPRISGPPPPRAGRSGAAPGKISTPDVNVVETELVRAKELAKGFGERFQVISGNEGRTVGPGALFSLQNFLAGLGIVKIQKDMPSAALAEAADASVTEERQKRQVQELVEHTQRLLRSCERVREEFVWQRLKTASVAEYEKSILSLKQEFWDDVIGRVPGPGSP